jgi:hypothetical protein
MQTDKETVKQPTKRRYFRQRKFYESDRQATNKVKRHLLRESLRALQHQIQAILKGKG